MLVNNQLTDLQVKAKGYEQGLHEEEEKRGIRISSTPPAKEEESWWDQLLAPIPVDDSHLSVDVPSNYPERLVDDVARRSALTPEEMLRFH